jgi:autotransporter-associated beta strand protein
MMNVGPGLFFASNSASVRPRLFRVFFSMPNPRCAASGLLSFALAFAWLIPSTTALAAAKPNIVLIMSDDAGYADFGFMNQFTGETTPFKTPRLDQLAAQSVAFRNAYVPSSICSITRAGIMTGKHPDSFGFSFNGGNDDLPYESLPASQKTVLERVKELGYSTGVIGKWHLGQQPQSLPTVRGADYFFGMWEAGANYYPNAASSVKIRRGDNEVDWSNEPSFNNIPGDPTRGRYLTDAFGDEASKYIADHAESAEPFFLYTALTAPHNPYDSKSQDYNQFPGLIGTRRQIAAMTLSLDRAVGNILDRINDPNGDGNQADSIADNTVILFLNDNGGANANYDNGPLAGFKGSGWEGGIRTPMLVRAPGVAAGVFNETVTGLDIFSTVEALAQAPTMTPTNGSNLMPYLTGQASGPVHEAVFFRNRVNFAAIREGDWKLVRPDANTTWKLFHLNPDGSGEDVDLQNQHPEIVADLVKKYVAFDVTLDKARNSGPNKVHSNDVFVRRNEAGANTNWQHATGWWNGDNLSLTAGISRDDPNPNMVLAFTPNNAADYRSTNTINRASGISRNLLAEGLEDIPGLGEVLLNEIRLEGHFSGTANRKATIDGKPLLFAKNLAGKAPGLRLDATQAAGPNSYTFNVDLNLILYHDFVIEGNGNANFRIGGAMSSFDPVSGVRKKGTSTVTFGGNNTFTGKLIVEGGKVIVDGATAAVDGAQEVRVDAGANLTLQSGLIRTPKLDVSQGTFDLLGGKLQAQAVIGNLSHAAGSVVIGSVVGPSTVSGNFQQTGGDLTAIVNAAAPLPGNSNPPPTNFTLAYVNGAANIAGKLIVQFDPTTYFPVGSTMNVLQAIDGLQGTFSQLQLTGVPTGSQWSVGYTANAVTLSRIANSFNSADFDLNGIIDGADFMIWQRNFGKFTSLGDANGDGLVNASDLGIVKAQFGLPSSSTNAAQGVPEPTSVALGALATSAIMLVGARRRQAKR